MSDSSTCRMRLLVCGGTGCESADSSRIKANLERFVREAGLADEVEVVRVGCFGFCAKGPIVLVEPDGIFYVEVKPEDAADIVVGHVVSGRIVERLLYEEPLTGVKLARRDDMPFYKKQHRVALRNCGVIDPENIHDYIGHGGYKALERVLLELKPAEVIDIVKRSGLRGRGGGGFPTGKKWEITAQYSSDAKYVVCNADEGDPGAFMDRSILEGDPHSVIEAMVIAGYAIGAHEGFIYIRAEYPLAVHRLEVALEQAKSTGKLGRNLLGTNFFFDVQIRYGAGAFVCGEETALINSIEGERGEPNNKPPFPAQQGLWGKPTLVNNVETFANIPIIVIEGPDWFSSIGTKGSKGTKVFALAGNISNVGLVEVPMGTTLREIVEDIGGGVLGGKKLKAIQTGGPSGGCITAENLDTPIDYENLTTIGSMMGSGGMIVIDENECMVRLAKFYLEFTMDESCGKCTACRVGNKRLYEMLCKITEGKGRESDLALLRELSETVKDSSLCGLGQTAPNPVLSTMRHFMNEYVAHVRDKKCPASVCKALISYSILSDKCVGCTACARVCPTQCISGQMKKAHEIDQARCIKCGACYAKCRFEAIKVG